MKEGYEEIQNVYVLSVQYHISWRSTFLLDLELNIMYNDYDKIYMLIYMVKINVWKYIVVFVKSLKMKMKISRIKNLNEFGNIRRGRIRNISLIYTYVGM